jgi:beta-alanine degradation protein BauB
MTKKTSRALANSRLLFEDESVRVTRYEFEPGAETGRHMHHRDCVITPVCDCTMVVVDEMGSRQTVTRRAGEAYQREKGTAHNVINFGEKPMSFIEVELK